MTDEDTKKVDELINVIKELINVEKQRNELLAKAYIYGWNRYVVPTEKEKKSYTENLLHPEWRSFNGNY